LNILCRAIELGARADEQLRKRAKGLLQGRRTQTKVRRRFQQRRARFQVNAEAVSVGDKEQRTREDNFRDTNGKLRVERSKGRPAKTVADMRNLRLAQEEQRDSLSGVETGKEANEEGEWDSAEGEWDNAVVKSKNKKMADQARQIVTE
jgi:hypothetical protein